jgi:hypothetical protein
MPANFSEISKEDIANDVWYPRDPALKVSYDYLFIDISK